MFGLLFIFSSCVFLAHYYIAGDGVWGDGRYYYAYTRSLAIDHDIHLLNESKVDPFYFDPISTPTGKIANKYSIGTAIVWLPSFVLAHIIALTAQFLGFPIIPNGYHHLYRIAVGFQSIAFAIGGLWITYKLLQRHSTKQVALIATLGLFLATHLFFYTAVDPINSHPATILLGSLILYLSDTSKNLTRSKIIGLGLLVGLLTSVRNQDSIFILPVIMAIWKSKNSVIHKILHLALAGIAAIIAFLPELITRYHLYGSFTSPYKYFNEGFNFFHPHIREVLLATDTGLLSATPVLFVSIVGLVILAPQVHLKKIGTLMVCMQLMIISSWSNWTGGESYGARMFLSLTPIFAFGLIPWIKKTPLPRVFLGFTILIGFNIFSMVTFLLKN